MFETTAAAATTRTTTEIKILDERQRRNSKRVKVLLSCFCQTGVSDGAVG